MITVHKIYPVGFAANTYLVTADGKTAVAIDPSQPRVLDEAKKRGLEVKFALLTHGHFDHIGGCAALQRAGAKIGCLKEEKPLVSGSGNLAEAFETPVEPFIIDFTAEDGETIELCGVPFRVIATPGHTAGGACYLTDGALFSGDTLVCGGVGRTDFPTGNAEELAKSLQKLFALGGGETVYTGHGEETTLAQERRRGE